MRFESTDTELFRYYTNGLRDRHARVHETKRPERLWLDAKLLWAGRHYLLVREGPANREIRTVLLNRETLLLRRGNESGNPLIALALASVHPMHKRMSNWVRVLHVSGNTAAGLPPWKGRRWCKVLLQEVVDWCKTQDDEFEVSEPRWIQEFEEIQAFSKRCMDYLEEAMGESVSGTEVADGYPRPAGRRYTMRFRGLGREFSFIPTSRAHRTVEVGGPASIYLDETEFKIWVNAFAEIERYRREKEQA